MSYNYFRSSQHHGMFILGFLSTFFTVAIAGLLVIGYFEFTSTAREFENGIEAQYKENQNVYDNGYKKVVETAQVTHVQSDQIKEVYGEVMRGLRGSESLMLALGQFNPNIDQQTYKEIQKVIVSFRNDFAQRQRELIARKNEYKNFLTVNWQGRFYNTFSGYPMIDLDKFDIVTSAKTRDAFESKIDQPLEIK